LAVVVEPRPDIIVKLPGPVRNPVRPRATPPKDSAFINAQFGLLAESEHGYAASQENSSREAASWKTR